jgi:hypothetical protein
MVTGPRHSSRWRPGRRRASRAASRSWSASLDPAEYLRDLACLLQRWKLFALEATLARDEVRASLAGDVGRRASLVDSAPCSKRS